MECDFAAYLFTLLCPLFTSGASFSIAHEYSVRNLNWSRALMGYYDWWDVAARPSGLCDNMNVSAVVHETVVAIVLFSAGVPYC